LVGKRGFLEKEGVDVSSMGERAEASMAEGKTVIYVSKDGRLHGIIALSSALHPEAAPALRRLRREGFAKVSLVSGDSEPVVAAVAGRLGFDDYRAALLPDEKARYVEGLEARGSRVLMVGDGVNDALAFAKATVGVAMGAGGSEVAMEAADITLVKSDLMGLVVLRRLSRATLRTVEQNFWIATATNVLGIVLGLGGWLPPVTAGVLHITHTLGIMLNSSRLLKWDHGVSSEGPPPE
jgi:cation-transporting P-type ATPase C